MKAFLFSALMIGMYSQGAFASCGTFEVSKGDVKVQPASGAAVPAPVGSKICSGDTVIAADSARAKIKMEDGNELNISPNSKIVIETYQYDVAANKKKVMLNVLRGKVRATTREENMYTDKAKDGQANTFQVRTKSAVAGVRGTDFLTGFDAKTSKMEVITFRGKVEVGLPGPGGTITNSVQVSVGQRTQVLGGRPPEMPKAMPAGDLMKQNNETHNETPAASSGSSASNTPAKSGDRAPASTSTSTTTMGPGAVGPASMGPGTMGPGGSSSMISTNDLPSATGSDALSSGPKNLVPVTLTAPPPPALPTSLTNNLIINNAITNKKANVTVNLHIGN